MTDTDTVTNTDTEVVHSPSVFRERCDQARRHGKRVALVPTMGALHQGHLALIDEAARNADVVVVTIFVNPLQFGDGEDLDRYPRTLHRDVAQCANKKVSLVFAPANDAMYADNFQSQVMLSQVTQPLEGVCRPGHFDGVTTVVAKLFNLTGPCAAVFGQKDYQQWCVLSQMVSDLNFPVQMIRHPIVREADGLALSSRNRYLNADERSRARCISQGLNTAAQLWHRGERQQAHLESSMRDIIAPQVDRIDYIAAVHPDTLQPSDLYEDRVVLLIAVYVGTTRLIDNVLLTPELKRQRRSV